MRNQFNEFLNNGSIRGGRRHCHGSKKKQECGHYEAPHKNFCLRREAPWACECAVGYWCCAVWYARACGGFEFVLGACRDSLTRAAVLPREGMYVQRPHGRCIRVAASERWRAFFLLGVRSLCAWQVAWARADTLYVGNQADGKTPGTDVGLCGDPDAPCRTVAYAASRALSGDTVIVKSGQYPFPAGEWLPQSSLTAITDITISGDVRGGAVFLGAGPSNAVLMDWTGSASGPFTTVKVQRLVFRDVRPFLGAPFFPSHIGLQVQPTNNLVHIAGQKHGPLSFVECDFINVESSSAQGGGVMRVDGGTEVCFTTCLLLLLPLSLSAQIALTLQDCDFQVRACAPVAGCPACAHLP